ncbi:hypothetical protein V865_008641 [Kwoniella europaea PYCC6329]|uniref:Xylanolytic transcriptional activator regulatory domain-containing protein n=1 Tax=Kwoniella europaea PYCC6329 TaxID=1423913 RepID=A0AAX4KVR5_9TREE
MTSQPTIDDTESSLSAQLRQSSTYSRALSGMNSSSIQYNPNDKHPFSPVGINEILFGNLNAMQPIHNTIPTAQESHQLPGDIHSTDEGTEHDFNRKKRKITRARNACLPPPDPCGSCLKDELHCAWPSSDGRSAEARRIRSHGKRKESKAGVTETNDATRIDQDLWTGLFGHDWLSDIGSASTSGQPFDFSLGSIPAPAYTSLDPSQQPTDSIDLTTDPTLAIRDLTVPPQSPDWLSGFDPAEVVMALSGQLPVVEDGSIQGDRLGASDTTSPAVRSGAMPRAVHSSGSREDKVVKVSWWRPHGQTAIVPGLQRIVLKVQVQAPGSTSQASTPVSPGTGFQDDLLGPDRIPEPSMMKHLLHIFFDYFGCQFPFLDKRLLELSIEERTGSSFLFLCIAAISARFSTHPSIALKHLEPFEYGQEFYKAAKELLGSMLTVPSRETVMGLVLLAHVGLGADSESEEWMFTGMAVRMSIDLGLQLNPPKDAQISLEDRRSNRLLFWSVLLLDFALAFGTGRQPTLRVEEITQLLPSLDDLPATSPSEVPNPFPYAARQMLAYGQLITVLNSGRQKQDEIDRAVIVARSRAIQVYNTLPEDLHWNVKNLQRHTKPGYATMFLHLHLWMHTIIASGYLTDTDYLRRGAGRSYPLSGLISGHVTPNAVAASNLWKNSARTIGDVLVLSDIINPNAYLSLPFCNQAFYVAGCCYVKEIETEQWNLDHVDRKSEEQSRPTSSDGDATARSPKKDRQVKKPSELFRSLLTSVAANNISTVQQGLTKQTNYWKGIAWVAEALSQRVAGIGASEIDLASITEKLSSSIYVADAGVLKGSGDVQQSATDFNGSTV